MRRTKTKLITFLGGMIAAILLISMPVFAAGGAYADNYNVEVVEGETAYISFGVDNAAGSYEIYTTGTASANGSGWLDNESAMLGIFGGSAGDGTVTISFPSLATYDAENLDGTELLIYVHVVPREDGNGGQDKGQEDEKNETDPKPQNQGNGTGTITDGRNVTINGEAFTILNDLSGLERPEGFYEDTRLFNGEAVQVLKHEDILTLYVFKNKNNGSISLMTYDDISGDFEPAKILSRNGINYFLVDITQNDITPKGYHEDKSSIDDIDIKGYASDSPEYADFLYVRAVGNGDGGFYAYDRKQDSFQRCFSLDEQIRQEIQQNDPAEPETKPENSGSAKLKLLKILLAAAAVVIAGLLIWLIILITRNYKKKGRAEQSKEIQKRQVREERKAVPEEAVFRTRREAPEEEESKIGNEIPEEEIYRTKRRAKRTRPSETPYRPSRKEKPKLPDDFDDFEI